MIFMKDEKNCKRYNIEGRVEDSIKRCVYLQKSQYVQYNIDKEPSAFD